MPRFLMKVLETHKIRSLPWRCKHYALPYSTCYGKITHMGTGGIYVVTLFRVCCM